MYGDNAQKLVLEAKRLVPDRMSPFNHELVQVICQEITYLADSLTRRMEQHAAAVRHEQQQQQQQQQQKDITSVHPTDSASELGDSTTVLATSSPSRAPLSSLADDTSPPIDTPLSSSEATAEVVDSSIEISQDASLFGASSSTAANTAPLETSPASQAPRHPSTLRVTLTAATTLELSIMHLSVQRSKRCLLAYLQHRLRCVMADTWQHGGLRAANGTRDTKEEAMSDGERHFQRDYGRLLRRYATQHASVGLLVPLRPPKELYVQVRAIRDGGLVQTEGGGALRLNVGTQCYLAQHEAERLIGLGLVRRV